MELNCYLIEPAENFLNLLCNPISLYFNKNNKSDELYNKWKFNFIELYNNRSEFLCMANTSNKAKTEEQEILNTSFHQNYIKIKQNFKYLSGNLNLWDNNTFINDDHFILNLQDFNINNGTKSTIDNLIEKEAENKQIIEKTMFTFIVFVFQYINIFNERSISNNLWNYCLSSTKFSYKCFFLGIITLLIQYIWMGSLLYSVIEDYSTTDNGTIILISILSTILSLLYSFNSIKSYFYSRYLYRFLLNVYKDFPEMSISNSDESKKLYYIQRKITMKKIHIIYNWWADFFSNFILPIIIPIVNFFIILNSESIIDAILNSVAIFFIVQIDEDLYSYSDYDNEKNNINFTRWMISTIYCHYFPLFKDIYHYECDSWFSKIFRLSKKNKIGPRN